MPGPHSKPTPLATALGNAIGVVLVLAVFVAVVILTVAGLIALAQLVGY